MKLYEGCFWCRTWLRGYLLLAVCTCAWLLSSHTTAAAAGSQDAAAHLLSCYNGVHSSNAQGHEHAEPATFSNFLQGLPPRLALHRVLWSSQRSVIPLTIATAVTPLRLSALEAQCASWRGPLAAALYLPLNAAAGKVQDESVEASETLSKTSQKLLREAEADAVEVFERAEARDGCQLRLLLLYEVIAPQAEHSSGVASDDSGGSNGGAGPGSDGGNGGGGSVDNGSGGNGPRRLPRAAAAADRAAGKGISQDRSKDDDPYGLRVGEEVVSSATSSQTATLHPSRSASSATGGVGEALLQPLLSGSSSGRALTTGPEPGSTSGSGSGGAQLRSLLSGSSIRGQATDPQPSGRSGRGSANVLLRSLLSGSSSRRALTTDPRPSRASSGGTIESGGDVLLRSLLPINSLRNAAVLASDTPLVAMVDVDLLLSKSLSEELADPVRARVLLRSAARRNVFILPAFETLPQLSIDRGAQVAKQAVAGDKRGLQQLLSSRLLITFAAQLYAKGHACTRFRTWFDSELAYATELTTNCEPWFIIQRQLSPQYDVRFRGYGWNKVSQVAHVASSGFDLFVHPSAFLVHMPHPSSKAMSAYMASDKARAAQKARAWEQQQAQEGRRGQEGRVGEGHRRKVGRWQVQGERTRRQGQGVVRGGGQGVRLLQAAGGKATHLGGAGMQAEAVQTAGPGQTVQPEQQRQEQRLDLRGQTGHADLQTDQRREVATGHRVQGQEEQGHTRQQQHQDAADAEPVLQAATSGAPRRLQQQAGRAGAAAGSQPKRPSAAARAFHRRVSELREQVLAELVSGGFQPVVDEASLRCRAELPWWQERG